jgi:response regulator RpfG family c-di-GMP phosphodiesterase
MEQRILFVDDDPNVLAGYQRQLRKDYTIEIALGAERAIELIKNSGTFAVLVSDMRMPQIDGVQLLKWVREHSPDTVRVMLTGYADQSTAIKAINEGHIFRFLTKPCDPETFSSTIKAALEQNRLITAESELLQKTLMGAIGTLTDLLSISDPAVFGRSYALRSRCRESAAKVGIQNVWQLELAALLMRIGQAALPPEVAAKLASGAAVSRKEAALIEKIPEIGANLLRKIPRLEAMAEIILYQDKHFDGSGFPNDNRAGADIPLESRLLRILDDLIELVSPGTTSAVAIRIMYSRKGRYDLSMLNALFESGKLELAFEGSAVPVQRSGESEAVDRAIMRARESNDRASGSVGTPCFIHDLRPGMVASADIRECEGSVMLPLGHVFTATSIEKLKNYAKMKPVNNPVRVYSKK